MGIEGKEKEGFNGDIEGRARGKGEPRLLLAWVDKV